jgi:hypothetical protein
VIANAGPARPLVFVSALGRVVGPVGPTYSNKNNDLLKSGTPKFPTLFQGFPARVSHRGVGDVCWPDLSNGRTICWSREGAHLPEPTSTSQAPFWSTGQNVSAKSCRDHFQNSQLRKQRRRHGSAGYIRPFTARLVCASPARVSARVSGKTSPNRLKLLECVGVSPDDYTGGGR